MENVLRWATEREGSWTVSVMKLTRFSSFISKSESNSVDSEIRMSDGVYQNVWYYTIWL